MLSSSSSSSSSFTAGGCGGDSPSTVLARHRHYRHRRGNAGPVLTVALLVVVTLAAMVVASDLSRGGWTALWTMPMMTAQAQETDTASGADADADASPEDPATTEENVPPPLKPAKAGTFNVKDHLDWGSYYDPKNVFCGKYDCYQILGFDYESFGKVKPDTKVITKRYRALSREWHPDKSKHKDAKERFVKIARAYEVLTTAKSRKEYDDLRYDQEAYVRKYGANVMWSYAPQSGTLPVVLFLLAVLNGFVYFAQYNKWKNVADRLAKAAVEEWTPSQGGTAESRELRDHALQIWQEREDAAAAASAAEGAGAPSGNGTTSSNTTSNSKKMKLSAKEKKQKQSDELRPIIVELAHDMHDFGAGFHKPTWRDLLFVKMAFWPYHLASGAIWQAKFYMHRIQKLEWTEEEKAVMTQRAVGHVTWELASLEDRNAMIAKELWIMDNLAAYREEQEIKKLPKAHQKQIAKMKKKGSGVGSSGPKDD